MRPEQNGAIIVLDTIKSHLPRPMYRTLRHIYVAIINVRRVSVFVGRMLRYRFRRNKNLPVVGVATVFIAKENILFLKEWILYHKLKGIEHFWLYDNTGVTVDDKYWPVDRSLFTHGVTNKYEIPYDKIISLSDTEIKTILDNLQTEIPNIHLINWQPKDELGNIKYSQEIALNHALKECRDSIDWMVYMDMDEFLVSSESIPAMCKWMELHGYDGGYINETIMSSRFDNLDKYVIEGNLEFAVAYPAMKKFMCNVKHTVSVKTHNFKSLGPQYKFNYKQLFFLHYKMPSSHIDMSKKFLKAKTNVQPELLNELQSIIGEQGSPEWRVSVVSPEWREDMRKVYPVWAMGRV